MGRPLLDVPDRSANCGYTEGASLENCQRARLVKRGNHHHMRCLNEREQASLRQKAMKSHSLRQPQFVRELLYFTLQCVLTEDVHLEFQPAIGERRQSTQQGGLVLDPIQTCRMDQPCGPAE